MSDEKTPQAKEVETNCDFSDLSLQIGTRLQLVLQRSGGPVSFFSPLIGYSQGEFILVKTPMENGLAVLLQDGDRLAVRVFSGVNVVSFDSSVAMNLHNVCNYLHLSYPPSVKAVPLRKAMRVKVALPAQVRPAAAADDANLIQATLVNLSAYGGLIESKEPCGQANDEIDVSFAFLAQPGNVEAQIKVKATIKSVKTTKAPGPDAADLFTCGVEFGELGASEQIMLQNLVYETVLANRKSLT
jgi:c-di-GMP-binding flagellar brake protein YcgR